MSTTVPETSTPSVPRSVAIIADGNARWAHQRGQPISAGHAAAADTLKARLLDALDVGISQLSVYVFSTENWSRPATEVSELMAMFSQRLALEAEDLRDLGIRVRFLGSTERLPAELIEQMQRVAALTRSNERLTLFLGFNYGARAEIIAAARCFQGTSEEEFRRCLYAPDMEDPELVIRTGGDLRLSNYLLWQAAYAELVFRDELWPDFTRACFDASLLEFNERVRRFGGRDDRREAQRG